MKRTANEHRRQMCQRKGNNGLNIRFSFTLFPILDKLYVASDKPAGNYFASSTIAYLLQTVLKNLSYRQSISSRSQQTLLPVRQCASVLLRLAPVEIELTD